MSDCTWKQGLKMLNLAHFTVHHVFISSNAFSLYLAVTRQLLTKVTSTGFLLPLTRIVSHVQTLRLALLSLQWNAQCAASADICCTVWKAAKSHSPVDPLLSYLQLSSNTYVNGRLFLFFSFLLLLLFCCLPALNALQQQGYERNQHSGGFQRVCWIRGALKLLYHLDRPAGQLDR